MAIEITDDDEIDPTYPGYPIKNASDDEKRRVWIIEAICLTPDGPILDKLPEHAAAIEAYLINGAKAKPRPVK